MTTIQVRNVPEELSRSLKARAASQGRSLSDYLLGELEQINQRPDRAELAERIARRGRQSLTPASDVLAGERASR
ncbi:toxin-antitoxin system, antitoxin component [Luteococcus sp. H138]|uniref:FitA-like ribbon-helix-helix domain-containing protein n=1 Tax=unclassified Luteococcus TaxID=2639923 RepID=UPI00313C3225